MIEAPITVSSQVYFKSCIHLSMCLHQVLNQEQMLKLYSFQQDISKSFNSNVAVYPNLNSDAFLKQDVNTDPHKQYKTFNHQKSFLVPQCDCKQFFSA